MTFGTKGFRAVKKAFKPVVASRQFHASRSSRGDQWLLPEDGTAGAGTDTGMKSGLSRSPRDVLLMLLPPYAAARASFHRSACSVVSM